MDKDTRLAIANEIYAQLGGVRFSLVTGARPISISETKDGDLELTFKIGRNGSKANRMRVTYEIGPDLYKVEFYRLSKSSKTFVPVIVPVASRDGVFCDQLAADFREVTGLVTTLPRFVSSK